MATLEAERMIRLHWGSWRFQVIFSVFAIGLAAFFWIKTSSMEKSLPNFWVAMACVTFFFLAGAIWGETCVDLRRGVVFRMWRFLGIIPLWRWTLPVGDFVGVDFQATRDYETAAITTVIVRLIRTNGRRVPLQYFNTGDQLDDARKFAAEISKLFGIPVRDDFPKE